MCFLVALKSSRLQQPIGIAESAGPLLRDAFEVCRCVGTQRPGPGTERRKHSKHRHHRGDVGDVVWKMAPSSILTVCYGIDGPVIADLPIKSGDCQ
jgi:hypothetical protein